MPGSPIGLEVRLATARHKAPKSSLAEIEKRQIISSKQGIGAQLTEEFLARSSEVKARHTPVAGPSSAPAKNPLADAAPLLKAAESSAKLRSVLHKLKVGARVRFTVSRSDFTRGTAMGASATDSATASVLSITDCIRETNTLHTISTARRRSVSVCVSCMVFVCSSVSREVRHCHAKQPAGPIRDVKSTGSRGRTRTCIAVHGAHARCLLLRCDLRRQRPASPF